MGAARGSRLLGWLAAASINDRQEGYNRYYTSLLILLFPKLIGTAVSSGEDFEDYRPSKWKGGIYHR